MCPDLSPTDVISLGVDLKDREAQKTESGRHLIQKKGGGNFTEFNRLEGCREHHSLANPVVQGVCTMNHDVAVATCKRTSPQDAFMFPKGIS